jgi:hypothetical protein
MYVYHVPVEFCFLIIIASQFKVPDATQGTTDAKWGSFLRAVGTIPRLSNVEIFVRGWDGSSTNAAGWVDFVQRFGSGQGNQPALNLRFWYFQPRESTVHGIKDLFG